MPSTTRDLLLQFLGNPSYFFTWKDAVEGGGITQRTDICAGVYAVSNATALLYVGKSQNLTRRLGQFIAASMGAWGLHSGGWRMFETRSVNRHSGDLVFDVWEGPNMYAREPEIIAKLPGALNRAGTLPELHLDCTVLRRCLDVEADPATRVHALSELLDQTIGSLGKRAYDARDWTEDGWRGAARRIGRRWRFTVWAGFKEGSIGIWVYDGPREWFPAQRIAKPHVVGDEDGLKDLVTRLRLAWNGWDDASEDAE